MKVPLEMLYEPRQVLWRHIQTSYTLEPEADHLQFV